jgi:4-alpha-glucanotransferase
LNRAETAHIKLMHANQRSLLHHVARLYRVQTMHRDGFARVVEPGPEVIFSVLRMLGAPLERMDDLPHALRQRRESLWQRGLKPVVVAWNGAPLQLRLRLPLGLADCTVRYRMELESGEVIAGDCQDDRAFKPARRCIESVEYVSRMLTIRTAQPPGYHRLHLEVGPRAFDALFLRAPRQSFDVLLAYEKPWGLFCPTYALATPSNWGAGEFSSLEALASFAAEAGAKVIGTLPLLAAFLDEPFDPSPYAPVSRLFWNEFYLDVERIPEIDYCPAARALIAAPDFRQELASLRAASLIDYRRIMALKRRVLEELLACLMSNAGARRMAFEAYVAAHPATQDYAGFRAMVEREQNTWQQWQEPARGGALSSTADPSATNYHLYVQWLAAEQVDALSAKSHERGIALYFDFPIGVNRAGYDVWRNQNLFALSASTGAPPDSLFVGGQNWGFPPLHPETIRQQGYRYYIDCLRHHLQHADLLRIDHVMGLHRMYWIPDGCAATEGVYVHYKAEELYAILSLELHRHGAQIVGENLGTVPTYTNDALARHRIFGLYVGQFSVDAGPGPALGEIPAHHVASLNTHDTATFAGFWVGTDIQDRLELGLIDHAQAAEAHTYRAAQRQALVEFLRAQHLLSPDAENPLAVLKAWLCFIAANGADLLLVNLEDLWLEPLPQNVPGTWNQRPNWRHKLRHSLDDLGKINPALDILSAVNQTRKRTE